jgi:hypothetical protein
MAEANSSVLPVNRWTCHDAIASNQMSRLGAIAELIGIVTDDKPH